MVHIIRDANWCGAIGNAIRQANDGDTIIVDTLLKAKLAEKAVRAQCPAKRLKIEVGYTAQAAIAHG